MSDVVIDGGNQFGDAGEYTAAQLIRCQVAKESFHHVQPGCGGGREVHRDARMLGQPFLDDGMLVGGIVVGDQM